MAVSAPAPLTAAFRARLQNIVARTLQGVVGTYNNLFDPALPLGSLANIGAGAAVWTYSAQSLAADEAARYLEAVYSWAAGVPLGEVEPFSRALSAVGMAASGTSLTRMTGQAPAVYLNRIANGWTEELAAASSLSWLNRLAASEPYRVANQTIVEAAEGDGRLESRISRITQPGACAFCVLIADRGYIPSHAGFAAHAHCRCTPGVLVDVRPPRGERAPAPAVPAENNRAETVPFEGFESISKANQTMVRETMANALRGIRPEIADRLTSIRIATSGRNTVWQDRGASKRALAWYMPDQLGRQLTNITIRKKSFGAQGDREVEQGQQTRDAYGGISWFVPRQLVVRKPDGFLTMVDHLKPKSGLQYVVTHETGHFLHDQLDAKQRADLSALIERTAAANWPADMRRYESDYMNKAVQGRLISRYAAKNEHETVAEAWAEYRLTENPRPLSKAIGDYLMQALG